jgi:hypothetical protein
MATKQASSNSGVLRNPRNRKKEEFMKSFWVFLRLSHLYTWINTWTEPEALKKGWNGAALRHRYRPSKSPNRISKHGRLNAIVKSCLYLSSYGEMVFQWFGKLNFSTNCPIDRKNFPCSSVSLFNPFISHSKLDLRNRKTVAYLARVLRVL